MIGDWKPTMLRVVKHAVLSPDPSTQNAAVLVSEKWELLIDTWAVNEFPKGVGYTPERWERPLKYSIIEHAERNAIYAAARSGICTAGLTLVCPWAACADCARAIIQAGISRLVTLRPLDADTNERWDESIRIAMGMLDEAGVEIVYLPPLNCQITIRRNGVEFRP